MALGLAKSERGQGTSYVDQRNTIDELKTLPGGDKFVNNNDNAGNSIVSRITRSLGSLKTLSGAGDLLNEGNRNFNLFTHHALLKEGKPLVMTYDALREGILELYLSVKIRSDDEIDNYNEEFFKSEKRELLGIDGFALIDYIKQSIEMLMNMKVEEQDEMENPDLFDGSLKDLRSSINRHERSERSPFLNKKHRDKGRLDIDDRIIDIDVGAE